MIYEKFWKFSYVLREFYCFENSNFPRRWEWVVRNQKLWTPNCDGAEKKISPSEETVQHEVEEENEHGCWLLTCRFQYFGIFWHKTVVGSSRLDYAEIAEDDCEVVADVDLWDELPSEEGVDDVEIETPPFERSEEEIAAIHYSVVICCLHSIILWLTELEPLMVWMLTYSILVTVVKILN